MNGSEVSTIDAGPHYRLMMQGCVVVLGALCSNIPLNAQNHEDAPPNKSSAEIELRLTDGRAKVVTLSLGQNPREIVRLCRPARLYADDDPWIGCLAAKGGHYALLFSADGTTKQMQGRRDPSRDKLYAVVHYPTDTREDGKFLLPESLQATTCGDFVSMRIILEPNKIRAATAVIGMSETDVLHLFDPAPNLTEQQHAVLFNSMDNGGRYLLIFAPSDEKNADAVELNPLAEIMYWPGKEAESIYLLPRKKRGKSLPAKHQAILEASDLGHE